MTDIIAFALIAPLAILIILSAFFSGTETAYTSVSYSKIAEGIAKGEKAPKLIAKHHKAFGKTLATILICNNLVNILSSTLIAMIIGYFMGDDNKTATMLISTFVMTPIIVAFGEITPKLLAKKYAYGYLKRIAYVMEILNWVFYPLTYPISKMTLQAKVTNTETELKTIIGLAAKEGVLEKREATLAQNALDLDSTKVGEVYTHKDQVVTLKDTMNLAEAKKIFESSGHSRIPLTKSGRYIGVVIIKDIVFLKSGNLIDCMHKVPTVHKSMNTTKALEVLRRSKSHIAFVKKTKNSIPILGIVTLEDIVEELIGEIYDEHDKLNPILQVGLHKYIAKGSASIIELGKTLKCNFGVKEDMEIKHWLQSHLHRKIRLGLTYKYKNKIVFKIISNKNGQETSIEITQK